jgi:hypothetical protein
LGAEGRTHFTKVTASRSAPEFADYLLDMAARYPEADSIHVGDEQPGFTYPQGDGGTLWRESGIVRAAVRYRRRGDVSYMGLYSAQNVSGGWNREVIP